MTPLKKYHICNKFSYDFWGCSNFRPKKIKKKKIFKHKVSFNYSQFLYKKLFQVFYNLNSTQLIKLSRKHKTSKKFISNIERSLGILLLRLHFSNSLISSKYLIKKKIFSVNNRIINSSSFLLNPHDMLLITSFYNLLFIRSMIVRHMTIKLFLSSSFSNVLVDYRSLSVLFDKIPLWEEINSPKILNLKSVFFYISKQAKRF